MIFNPEFYRGKRVLITGHTGFKGSWMCEVLLAAGAEVSGYALNPPTNPSIFNLLNLSGRVNSIVGDIRDLEHLLKVFEETQPEIVIHMAAQPIVRESYKNPVLTYETNVMGIVNVLEAVRHCDSVKSVVNVTTDKVYLNKEWLWGYRENEELNGYDPYSNSKSCSELVTSSYKNSFFSDESGRTVAISTCRAGNVIGGGDYAKDRIIPDCIRSAEKGESIIVRNPDSVRPYQHVLEPVAAYLMIAQEQYNNHLIQGAFNIGPNESDSLTTGELVDLFCGKWNKKAKEYSMPRITWLNQNDGGPHEANLLKLDCSKMKSVFGWNPKWSIDIAIEKIVEWTLSEEKEQITKQQIQEYLNRN